MDQLKDLADQAQKAFAKCQTVAELDHAKAQFIGKSGVITDAMRACGYPLSGL